MSDYIRVLLFGLILALASPAAADVPIHLTFHWHMHQPIYWPYEPVTQTESGGQYGFSVQQVHTDCSGPYTDWPVSAVQSGMDWGFDHLGAQVSLSGSLIENLNTLEGEGWAFQGWKNRWDESQDWTTSLGNPRLYLVSFGYHHPLMALVDDQALELQVAMHAEQVQRAFGQPPGPGMFPPEMAFSPRMIPALVEAGVEWIIVDSIHLERAHVDYPWNSGSNLVPPNGADVINDHETDWVTLVNLWAPSPVAAPWAYRPHWAVYIDPETGDEHRIIVVPAARYEGNEDARGGYGALLYDSVFRSYLANNDDPDHPMLVVLAHDGDNYGGGTDSYYNSNFQGFLGWLQDNPTDFIGTTIQDYLDQYPPDPDDTLHLEDGSWSGADNGDPEFAKWNGDPGEDGYSPDRNSSAVMTAALNHVLTADALAPYTSAAAVIDGSGSDTDLAWRWLLVGQTSCYWYWDNSEGGIWDSHPTRAANEAVAAADRAVDAAGGGDPIGPSIYLPQREAFNPGGYEWADAPEPTEFEVWTFAYDVSGLTRVDLRYRVDDDACRDAANEVYGGGGWETVSMDTWTQDPQTDPQPSAVATGYRADLDVGTGVLVDYYVEAEDTHGNVTRSPIMHVAVGELGSGGTGPWDPEFPSEDDEITIHAEGPGWLHWGVNGWQRPDEVYWPAGTVDWGDGLSVETPLDGPDGDGLYHVTLGPLNDPSHPITQVDFLFHWSDDTWSSPDQVIPINAAPAPDALPEDCVPYYRSGGYEGDDDDAADDDDDDDDGDDDDEGGDDDDDDDDATADPDGSINTCDCRMDGRAGAAGWWMALALIALHRLRR